MQKKKAVSVLLVVLLAAFFAGCSSGFKSEKAASSSGAASSDSGMGNGARITYSGNWRVISRSGKSDVKVLNLPDVRQSTTYTCGVSSLQAILFYYGLQYREGTLAEYAGSNANDGTPPDGFKKAVDQVNKENKTNLTVAVKQDAEISDIEKSIHNEIPVIVNLQAWKDADNTAAWKDDKIDGHYVVAVGYDNDNLYFEDPSLMASIGSIQKSEFSDRWHDYGTKAENGVQTQVKVNHLIIIVQGGTPTIADPVLPLE